MTSKNLLVFLVSAFALVAILATNASAFGTISAVEVDGVNALAAGVNLAGFAGERMPVLVVFDATADAEDVRVKVWISGERENTFVSNRFDVIAGVDGYRNTVWVDIPSDLDELDEPRKLEIVVENKVDGTADEKTISLNVQRESYELEILSVDMESSVKAGDNVAVDVVLKNRGSHFADDAFVKVRIPELGVEARSYFGDLSAQDTPDKEDAVERRTYVRVPFSASPGIYTVEIEAFNADSVARVTERLFISGAGEDSVVISAVNSKTFAVGEVGGYDLTVVNKGSNVQIYTLTAKAPSDLSVYVSEPILVVPAGSSRTVKIEATSAKEGTQTFAVEVNSDAEVISTQAFTANVEGKKTTSVTANATVLLTVVLAIIFVVLIIVLIVLLTRKPEKSEETGESYY